MNFQFSLTHNNLVAETLWSGDLTYEIFAAGLVSQNQWIINNSDKLPLVLVSNFSKANLNKVTENDLQTIVEQYHGIEDLFPGMHWVAIMPDRVEYRIVRLWLDYAEYLFSKAHVVRGYMRAKETIAIILMNFRI